MKYIDFLKSKIDIAPETGFKIDRSEINPICKEHQKDAIMWAVRGGRRGLFESCGLGKTIQQLEFCRLVLKHKGGKALIVVYLGVRQEFTNDAVNLLGMERPEYVRNMDEVRNAKTDIMLTNYERVRDGDIDPKYFTVTALDEASCLRSFGSKTYQTFLDKFKGVPYKLVSTATPSPNRFKELIHYAGYLEIMDTGQALTRFFKRDSTKANNLTLYPGKEDEFWLWVSSWGLFIDKPSDLGYSDQGYSLPDIEVNWRMIKRPELNEGDDGQLSFIQTQPMSLKKCAKEKRDTITDRVLKAKEIIDSEPENSFIIWHNLEAERRELKKEIPGIVDIYGNMDYDEREKRTIDFSEGRIRLFATKKSLSGSGCNFQRHCHRAIFLGIDYEFNDFYQAVHRIYRFMQKEKVVIDIIYTENEAEVKNALLRKWEQHDYMAEKMRAIIKKYGLSDARFEKLNRKLGVKRMEVEGKKYRAINNDCVAETKNMPSDSIGLIHTSIPFSNHYEYSANYSDFGHNESTGKFFEQMDYLTPELLRVLKPGRVAAIHVKDRVLFGNATGKGMPTIEPFHAMCIRHYMKHGFQYFGMITVVTDVVRENNQTYRLGYTEQCKDGSKMGVGCPEYILLFRKLPSDTSDAYADEPVEKSKSEYPLSQWQLDAHSFWRSSGDRPVSIDDILNADIDKIQRLYRKYSRDNVYDYEEHTHLVEQLANADKLSKTFMVAAPGSWSPEVWDDVNRMRTLNTDQARNRKTMHICPLQFDIVERIINRFSNEGDTVYDPFAGLFTVPYIAVKKGRYGIGVELNEEYFCDGLSYLESVDNSMETISMFDLLRAAE